MDPTPTGNDNTSPEDADETDGHPQRSSANDTEPDDADDVSPRTTKHSPVTQAAEEQLKRDNHAKDEAQKEKQRGKERDKEKEALRSPVRRS